jgi:hypothetical protein
VSALNFAAAHAAMRALCGGRYFSVRVESTELHDGTVAVEWSGYVSLPSPSPGWTPNVGTAEEMLRAVRAMVGAKNRAGEDALDGIGCPHTGEAT